MKTNKKYNHIEIQKKWNRVWEDAKIYHPNLDTAKNPFYALYMFPYPSAEGLHMGHAFSGTGADVYARFKRMKGENVFQPMGFDAFGIHSENFALKINDHPRNLIDRATKHFREQFDSLGFSYDWNHSVNTSSPDYYKWTQWLFIQLFKAGLAEKKKAEVNWCPSCKTVLADEQVIQESRIMNQESREERVGVCERCETEVERKELEQWFFKITIYADRLLEGLDRIDWTPKVLLAQRNWIGRSEGARIRFVILNESEGSSESRKDSSALPQNDNKNKSQDDNFVEVFTTRPDTLFGATFLVVSPNHPFVKKAISKLDQNAKKYIEDSSKRGSDIDFEKEKTGVFSGFYAINPATKEKIPVWIADYVLMGYGTGAIMAVPAHDERDFEFAKKYDLAIKYVLKADNKDECYTNRGQIIDSRDWTGWDSSKDFAKILDWLEEKEIGKRETHYHLRDWLISRQRYWGAPIPMIFCESCKRSGRSWFNTLGQESGNEARSKKQEASKTIHDSLFMLHNSMKGWFPVPESDLPVLLPYIKNFKPLGTGVAPLAQDKGFVNTTCPVCKGPAKRETDVADTFLDSSWYFLRYPSVGFDDRAIDQARTKKWLPVNSYIGGAEHSVLHLLYSRFVTKALFDQKLLDFDEPFTKFRAHGLIIKDGAKMSKSKGNVVNPDEYIAKYGADTLRCYLMFLGPYDAGGDFRDSGIEGMERFLKRVRKLVEEQIAKLSNQTSEASAKISPNTNLDKSMNKAIKGVGDDVESLRYNTSLAKIMEYVNDLTASKENIEKKHLKALVLLLAPFAPYLAEELWEVLGELTDYGSQTTAGAQAAVDGSPFAVSVHQQPWPEYDPKMIEDDEISIAVQINGKLRGVLTIDNLQLTNDKLVEDMARKDSKISAQLEGKEVKKVIYVAGKIINFVV